MFRKIFSYMLFKNVQFFFRHLYIVTLFRYFRFFSAAVTPSNAVKIN